MEYVECVFFQDTARSLVWWRNVSGKEYCSFHHSSRRSTSLQRTSLHRRGLMSDQGHSVHCAVQCRRDEGHRRQKDEEEGLGAGLREWRDIAQGSPLYISSRRSVSHTGAGYGRDPNKISTESQGALKVIERWLPELEDEKKKREEKEKKEKEEKSKKEKEEKEKAKSRDKDKDKFKDKSKDKGKEKNKGTEKDGDKEREKSRSKK